MPRRKFLLEIPFCKEGAVVEVPHKHSKIVTRYKVTKVNGGLCHLVRVDEHNKQMRGRPVSAVMVLSEDGVAE